MARVLIFFFLASVCTQVLVLLLLHLLVDKKEFAQRIPADIDRPIEVELFFPHQKTVFNSLLSAHIYRSYIIGLGLYFARNVANHGLNGDRDGPSIRGRQILSPAINIWKWMNIVAGIKEE